MSWRIPMYRWNWRLVRRERRQWLLIVVLLVSTVTVGVLVVTAGFNLQPSSRAITGDASHVLVVTATDETPAVYASALSSFPDATLVTSSSVRLDGSASSVVMRSLDPNSVVAAPLIALIEGRYPATDNELAGTQRQIDRLGIELGGTIRISDQAFQLVGVVENPQGLSEQFLLAAPHQVFGERVEILVTSTDESVSFFEAQHAEVFVADTRDDRTAAAMVLATVVAGVLVEVALMAVAALTVLAQRRIRQLGVLAALGANRRQLRAAVVAGAVVVGGASATIGAVLGVLAAWLIVPQLEAVADRRITTVEYPWLAIAAIAVLAAFATVIAAWWPARRVADLGVAGALRSRRPAARPVWRITIAGLTLAAVGTGIVLSDATSNSTTSINFVLYAAGFIAIPIGAVLLAPASVRLWTWLAPRLGLVAKVAARDVGRYQTRSAATVASLIVVFTIPVFVAAGSRVLERSDNNVPTMATNQAIITMEGCHQFSSCGTDLAEFDETIADLAAAIDARPVALQEAVRTFDGEDGFRVEREFNDPLAAGIVTEEDGGGVGIENVPTYVATPDLLEALGIDDGVFEGADVVTNRSGDFAVFDPFSDAGIEYPNTRVIDFPRYKDTPGALYAPSVVEAAGWEIVTTGWLLQSDEPISDDNIALLTRQADTRGLDVGAAEPAFEGATTRTWALVAGGLLALGIVAIISALHRTETASTNITYEAVGARSSFRRFVHALSMTMLVTIAVALAVPAGLLLQLGFARDILGVTRLWESIPVGFITALVTMVPFATLALGWITAAPDRRDLRLTRHFS